MSKVQSNTGFKWLLILAGSLLLPLLVGLGFWQLDRAGEKEKLISSWKDQQILSEFSTGLDINLSQYRSIRLDGEFDPHRYLLLDNKLRRGLVGFEVIGLFYHKQDLLLVNLGWIVAGKERTVLPKVVMPKGTVKVSGSIRNIEKTFVLSDEVEGSGWPKVIQSIDPEKLSDLIGQRVSSYEVKVRQGLVPQLDIHWAVSEMLPERHVGYAFQWFAMAVALFVLIVWGWRLVRQESAYE